jgi:hypothetical protein
MKKWFVFCVAVAAALLISQQSFAGTICLQDNFGELFRLTGGKIDKKSFVVKIDVPGFCVVTGHAETSLNGLGQTVIGMLTSHDLAGQCLTVRWSLVGDALLNATGSFDQYGDGTNDGAVTYTRVNCSTLPPFGPTKTVDPNSPLIKQR